eukprot:TRINITY_DN12847_c0_g1_i1.p1 TRINITY_DN12847_c0_g1~~TRINITY_DN12847_c0_g1_i1.p1  ORF type:complete len:693 (-),score=353.08 TRINITY_DN12847_c0_g1_i1:100-2145(-)
MARKSKKTATQQPPSDDVEITSSTPATIPEIKSEEDLQAEIKQEDHEIKQETDTTPTPESKSFEDLKIDERLLKAISKIGWGNPTPIQLATIPLALAGKDILARAKTGSGKTGAYALPLLHKILTNKSRYTSEKGIKAVVLVPTRELCEQAYKVFVSLIAYCSKMVSVLLFSADDPIDFQHARLEEQPDIVISTPGRLSVLFKSAKPHLRKDIQMLVVDEADLLLSYGYEADLKLIVKFLPKNLQSFLMSATLSTDVEILKGLILNNPVILKMEEKQATNKIIQYIIRAKDKDKYLFIFCMLQLKLVNGKAIIFTNNISRSYQLKLFLERFSIKSAVLNSELPQNSRSHVIDQFNKGVFRYLIATDEQFMGIDEDEAIKNEKTEEDEEEVSEPLAKRAKIEAKAESESEEEIDDSKLEPIYAEEEKGEDGEEKSKEKNERDRDYGVSRGVDFKNVATVINFDVPRTVQSYVHRIGRTARAGTNGVAFTFVTDANLKYLATLTESLTEKGETLKNFALNATSVEKFRYRVEDVRRGVTLSAVKEARMTEIRNEILNSQKLKTHFEDNPLDLASLMIQKHHAPLLPAQVKKHLSVTPSYLLPTSNELQASETIKKELKQGNPKANTKQNQRNNAKKRHLSSDPLKTFKSYTPKTKIFKKNDKNASGPKKGAKKDAKKDAKKSN